MRIRLVVAAVAGLVFSFCSTAAATPVATSDSGYTVLGRVFPDPLSLSGQRALCLGVCLVRCSELSFLYGTACGTRPPDSAARCTRSRS